MAVAAIIAIRGERAAEREGAPKKMAPFVGMIVFGIGFCICVAWYWWPISRAAESVEEKPVLYFDCQIHSGDSIKVPDTGVLYTIPISAGFLNIITGRFTKLNLRPGGYYNFNPEWQMHTAYACTIYNLTQEPIHDVSIDVLLVIKNRSTSYKLDTYDSIATRKYKVYGDFVDARPNNQFMFYFINLDNAPGYAELMEDITYKKIGSPLMKGKLAHPTVGFANKVVFFPGPEPEPETKAAAQTPRPHESGALTPPPNEPTGTQSPHGTGEGKQP